MLLMEQTQQMQLHENNLMRSTLKQLQVILIFRILTMSSTANEKTFNEMNAIRNTLVCFEDVRDVFVSRKESVFPMASYLEMGNN